MDKRRAIIAVKVVGYGAVIVILSLILYLDKERVETLKLKYCLRWGTPVQKEAVLDLFMLEHRRALVPAVIDAMMDDTVLPRHGDTGWGTVYHQAASAMDRFAQQVESQSPWQRRRNEYSFGRDVGIASLERRKEVHRNWRRWYAENKNARLTPRLADMSGWRASCEGHFRLAHIYARIGDHKGAVREYKQLLANTSPVSQMGEPLVYYHIMALICLNRDEEAKAVLAQALERFDDSEVIRNIADNYDNLPRSWEGCRIKK